MQNLQAGIGPGATVIDNVIGKKGLMRQGHLGRQTLFGLRLVDPVTLHDSA